MAGIPSTEIGKQLCHFEITNLKIEYNQLKGKGADQQ